MNYSSAFPLSSNLTTFIGFISRILVFTCLSIFRIFICFLPFPESSYFLIFGWKSCPFYFAAMDFSFCGIQSPRKAPGDLLVLIVTFLRIPPYLVWKLVHVTNRSRTSDARSWKTWWLPPWPLLLGSLELREARCLTRSLKQPHGEALVVRNWGFLSSAMAVSLAISPSGPVKSSDNCSPACPKAMAPHSSPLAWNTPWMEEPGRLQSMRSLRVRHDWATSLSLSTFTHWRRKWQPTPVFLPGESHERRSLVGCSPWGCTELDTTEVT